jgi:hypothetical protein
MHISLATGTCLHISTVLVVIVLEENDFGGTCFFVFFYHFFCYPFCFWASVHDFDTMGGNNWEQNRRILAFVAILSEGITQYSAIFFFSFWKHA